MDTVIGRIRAIRSAAARVGPVPLLVRAGIFLTALLGLVLAYPSEVLLGRPLVALLLVALLPALSPRRIWPSFAVLVAAAGWLVATDGYGRPIALWRLLAVATLLYLTHTLCALAAVLPYDAVVDPGLVLRWLLRAGAVILGAAVLGVLLVELSGAGGAPGIQAATVAGLVVAAAVTALLGWLLRRP
ncbi:hypothetical protein QTQ03_24100 [Micromonospora sp. WMMA1363]|uniref:hypothetical protein n=1 Tax=Micromonospora sp. WMMA1363 TaxID=3053985 RepID=UPI00259C906C|nr:hypothetical protein [Micromonospora sp. WMMA1363]MDM4722523.1 hypothetical protein [Micromonospora sp. WMMA1363]